MRNFFSFSLILFLSSIADAVAEGRSKPWQINFQEPVTPVMEWIVELHNQLLILIVVLGVFVLGLLVYTMVKFSEKANPKPKNVTHNTFLEIAWTVIPTLILVIMAVPSLKLLYFSDRTQDAEMTLEVMAHQWYWSYRYPDHGDFEFESYIVDEEDLEADQVRLLTVDNSVKIPVDTTIKVLVSTDPDGVIHNWAVPAFGIKMDAVPGRLNETWMKVTKEGVYYGMCSELCGMDHGRMPIMVEVVSKDEFVTWTKEAAEEFAQKNNLQKKIVMK